MNLTAEQIIQTLGLKLHSTCGYAGESFQTKLQLPANVLPAEYGGPRKLGGTLYFLVTPTAPVKLHRIRSDQMYHHYFGDPLEILLLYEDGKSETLVVGPDLAAGMRPQVLVPGNCFHAARVLSATGYALLGTSVWLRAEPQDVEPGNAAALMAKFPAAKDKIASFAKSRAS